MVGVKMVECPYCEGRMQVKDWVDDVYGNTKSFYMDCECCGGEGSIPEPEYESAKSVYPTASKILEQQIERGE